MYNNHYNIRDINDIIISYDYQLLATYKSELYGVVIDF